MRELLEYLKIPGAIATGLIIAWLIMQVVGELIEFRGKAVPEFMKIRKYFARKKREKKMMREMPELFAEVKLSLDEINKHYNADNIQMRDQWIQNVNHKMEQNDVLIRELGEKIDKNNKDTLAMRIDSMREKIIAFGDRVVDDKCPVTREQYNRIFKLHAEYEKIIEDNGLTNGEVDIAYRIARESYERHMREHSFVENLRGY